MGGGEVGGGFFTGWKGISVGVATVAGLAGLAGTGYFGSENNKVKLGIASSTFVGEADFGFNIYDRCIQNGTYDSGAWEHVFESIPDGDGGIGDLIEIPLAKNEPLEELGVETTFTNTTTNTTEEANFRNRPENACFTICRSQFNESCTGFTYDGLTKDTCRFVSPGSTPPEVRAVDEVTEGTDFYVFDATCMQSIREDILSAIDQPKPDLTRPDNNNTEGGAASSDAWDLAYDEAMELSLTFLRAQWAGALPVDYNETGPGNEWRKAGFVDKDAGCPDDLGGSFATGDHVQVTMATAEQTGVMSLARLWWNASFTGNLASLALEEIGRQSLFLTKAWDAEAEEVMVGVGDQLNSTTDPPSLIMFSDFGSADFALAVGEDPDNANGQSIPVEPECTFTSADAPAADVAAHSAAALALSSVFLSTQGVSSEDSLESARGMYEYAKTKAPLDVLSLELNATDAGVPPNLGASNLYPNSDDTYVRSHQLWAACTLFQATQEDEYWEDAKLIYLTFIRPENDEDDNPPAALEPYQLFDPVANYYNPLWWGLLCMAQSAPEYTGLEDRATLEVPDRVADGAEGDTNYLEFLLDQEFDRGTRAEVTQQIWQQFVLAWITYDGALDDPDDQRVTSSVGDNFRYFDINGPADDQDGREDQAPGVPGIFRDSAGAAVVALMYADLPGVAEDNSHWSRCMAVQNINFLLGDNTDQFSYMVGFGNTSPNRAYHKDAACPSEEIRAQQFEFVFTANAIDEVANEALNISASDATSTRLCDFLTFIGDPAVSDVARPADAEGNTFYDVGDTINPVLDNVNGTLSGALVSSFLPAEETRKYTDERFVCPDGTSFEDEVRTVPETSDEADDSERCDGEDPVANPLSQVSVDGNGVLTAALAGIQNLPPSFWERGCPGAQELAETALEAFTLTRNAPSVQIEEV